MVITYYGEAFTKLQFGDMVIAINPISKKHDSKAPKFGADISLISQNVESMSGYENMSFGNKEAFVIDGPGEYELSGVFIKSFPSEGPAGRINTIYEVELENMRVVHLGGLADEKLSPDVVEEISGCDVLIVPVGGLDSLEPKTISKFATSLEPKVIIPVLADKKENLETFLKDMDADKVKPIDKFSFKKKDISDKKGEVVLLSKAS